MFARLYVRVGILLRCRKHFHNRIISLRGKAWFHRNSYTIATFYISACLNYRKWVDVYLCVRWMDFASFYNFSIGFLGVFRQCGTFCFSFISLIDWLIKLNITIYQLYSWRKHVYKQTLNHVEKNMRLERVCIRLFRLLNEKQSFIIRWTLSKENVPYNGALTTKH